MKFRNNIVLYIFLVALFTRLVFLGLTYPGKEKVDYWEHVEIATNLLDGNGYSLGLEYRRLHLYDSRFFQKEKIEIPVMEGARPTALKPPVYPLLIALVFWIFGMKNFIVLFVLQAFLSSLTCLFLFLYMGKINFKVAVITGFGAALYPPFVYHSTSSPENTTLYLFLLSLFLYCILKLTQSSCRKIWLITGAIAGTLALTEVVAIPFILLCLSYVFLLSRNFVKERIVGALIAILAFSVVTSPWIIRNYSVFGKFGLFRTGEGQSLTHGFYYSGIGVLIPEEKLLALEIEGRAKNEYEENRAIVETLVPFVVENMDNIIRVYLPKNFIEFWWETPKYISERSLRYMLGRKIPYIFLLYISLPSMVWAVFRLVTKPKLTLRKKFEENVLIILILTLTVIYTLFGTPVLRYHFPIQLVMFVFFAKTCTYVHSKVKF